MRVPHRATVVALSALIVAAIVSIAASMPSLLTVVVLASTTVLIMGGTGHPLSSPADTTEFVEQYIGEAVDNYVSPSSTHPTAGIPGGPYNSVAVITPEEAAPSYGTLTIAESVAIGLEALHSCISSSVCDYNADVGSVAPSPSDSFVVYGYSQSATIALLEKARLADEYAEGEGPDVSFVLAGGNRPNGGLAYRDPEGDIIGFLFGGGETSSAPTPIDDTQYQTVDIAIQYDGLADAPLNPLNLLASLNAYMGMIALHPTYGSRSLAESGVINQGKYGDTTYYLMPTPVLPLLMPLQQLPFVGSILADALDPALRVLVEAAYDRTLSPAQPTPFNMQYSPNPIALAGDFLTAIPIGWDNAIEDVFGARPFGTQRPGPYGVGGPALTELNPPAVQATLQPATTAISTDPLAARAREQAHTDALDDVAEAAVSDSSTLAPDIALDVDSAGAAVQQDVPEASAGSSMTTVDEQQNTDAFDADATQGSSDSALSQQEDASGHAQTAKDARKISSSGRQVATQAARSHLDALKRSSATDSEEAPTLGAVRPSRQGAHERPSGDHAAKRDNADERSDPSGRSADSPAA